MMYGFILMENWYLMLAVLMMLFQEPLILQIKRQQSAVLKIPQEVKQQRRKKCHLQIIQTLLRIILQKSIRLLCSIWKEDYGNLT